MRLRQKRVSKVVSKRVTKIEANIDEDEKGEK